jgi:hypothetical protein
VWRNRAAFERGGVLNEIIAFRFFPLNLTRKFNRAGTAR